MNLPTVSFDSLENEYATISVNRVNVAMKTGYVFYDLADYEGLTDEEGNPREPYPEEIAYSRRLFNTSVNRDFSTIVIVPESEVPADQIFGTVTPPTEVM